MELLELFGADPESTDKQISNLKKKIRFAYAKLYFG